MRFKSGLLISALFGLTLTSCNLDDFFSSIKEIEIQDFKVAYYQGASFDSSNELQILAKYTNGTQKYLSYKDVGVTLKQGKSSYSAHKEFSNPGEYKVIVNKGPIKSNSITINVDSSAKYATSLALNASTSVIDTMEVTTLTVDVSPSDYNFNYEFELSTETSSFTKVDKNTYEFYDSRPGESKVTLKAKSGSDTFTNSEVTFNVTATYVEQEIEQTYKTLNTKNSPTIGEVKYLVVPIWFTDSSNYIKKGKETIRKDVQTAFFGTSKDAGWNSVSSFYEEESCGTFKLSGTVSEWYNIDKKISDVGVDNETAQNTCNLARDVANWYFTNHTEDNRTNYDYDGDGYIDGFVMIYAAPDCYANGVSESYAKYSNLWAYCQSIQSVTPSTTTPDVKVFLWASYDFMYGYTDAINKTGSEYYKGSTSFCNIDTHTYIHETGHILGLEDYYDYSQTYRPAGAFSMQDYNVGGHDPYSLMALGWAKPYIATKSSRIKIGKFQDTREFILLSPNWNSYNSVFDEYILLELYSPNGLNKFDSNNAYTPYGASYPQGASSIGVRLWHVDARLTRKDAGSYVLPLFNDATSYRNSCLTAFTNTYMKKSIDEPHLSPLVRRNSDYALYNLLSLIRNDKNANHLSKKQLSNSDLFYAGDSFSMEDYGAQFPYKEINKGTSCVLNSGTPLGWSFKVESIKDGSAVIEVIKE